MNRPLRLAPVLALAVLAALALSHAATDAGLADKIKKKFEDKSKKTEESVDKATGTADDATKSGTTSGESGASGGSGGGAATKVSDVSTKFDFVPGDKLLFYDDMSQVDLGEFPTGWKLNEGTFETADLKGERWLRVTSQDGRVRLQPEGMTKFPEFWTLEFDYYCVEPVEQSITVRGMAPNGSSAWEGMYASANNYTFRSGAIFASTPLDNAALGGRHHFMFLGRGKAVKAYVDQQRVANVPQYEGANGDPVEFEFRLWQQTRPMITNVRFAEGPQPPKDMLASGKLVTYGILFATGSDVVQPESAPVIRQVAAYMEANPNVRLKITGHTDNVGGAASNLDLSKRRAASVAKVLSDQFKVAAERFETDGKGDTQSVASNAKPEGRAMNRRVEFAKL